MDSISLQDGTWNCNPIAADLAATLAVAPESLNAGQNLEYTVTVTNPGPQSASAVMVTNMVPPRTDFVSASPSCVYSNGILICAAGTLSANAATNFTIVLAPRAIGPVTNTVQVSTVTPDPNPANDSAALVIIQTGVPPQITSQPLGQTLLIGSKAFLGVTASGTSPLAYQWFFNNTYALFGANSNDLTILDVQPSHAGSYFVVVTNFFGSITSAPATLRVLVPPAFDVSALSVLRDQTTVSFQSTVGLIYTLEYTRLLQPAEWVPILPQATGDGGPITLRDTNSIPIPESRFYRIRYE